MHPDAPETWQDLRQQLPAARTRAADLEARLTAATSTDLAKLLVAELSTALEELSVALGELDEQHGMVLELQGMVDASVRRAREAFDALPEAVAFTDLRGLLVEANAAMTALARQPAERLRGKPLAALVVEGSRRRFYDLLEESSTADGHVAGELSFRLEPTRAHRVVVSSVALGPEPALCWRIADVPRQAAVPPAPPVAPPAAESPRVAAMTEELEAARTLAAQLQHALDSRIVIEQAKGRLAERLGVTELEAFELLRRRARATGTKLQVLAQAVISGELDLS